MGENSSCVMRMRSLKANLWEAKNEEIGVDGQ